MEIKINGNLKNGKIIQKTVKYINYLPYYFPNLKRVHKW